MTTLTVNDALVQLDHVVNAAKFILEELETHKNTSLSAHSLTEEVKRQMDTYEFKSEIVDNIRLNYGAGLCREVAFYVMTKIDADIEAFINARVTKALEEAGVRSQN